MISERHIARSHSVSILVIYIVLLVGPVAAV